MTWRAMQDPSDTSWVSELGLLLLNLGHSMWILILFPPFLRVKMTMTFKDVLVEVWKADAT